MLQGFEGQPLQILKRDLKSDTMEVEDGASFRKCESSEGESAKKKEDLFSNNTRLTIIFMYTYKKEIYLKKKKKLN